MMEKIMDRPTYTMDGTDFYVDTRKEEFMEVADEKNVIPFYSMTLYDDHYDLLFNRKLKNITIDHLEESNMVTLRVPMIKDLDPEGFSKKHGIPLSDLEGKTDFELLVDQDMYQVLTTEGNIREIVIHDHVYQVDLYADQLHSKDGTLPSIRLSDFNENWHGNLSGYYNTKTGLMVKPTWFPSLYIPEHTVKIEIESSVRLDQIAFAKIYGLNPKDTVWRYPPNLKMVAKVQLLSQPVIGKHAKKSIEEDMKVLRKRRGKGLK